MTAIITPITQPFAHARENVLPSTVPSDSVVNQPNGFPIDQMLDPSDPNWQAVKEQEMNGVFNYYTNILFQLGQGELFTFNQALSDMVIDGIKEIGYPLGAILWCASNNTFQRSLVANNTANFVTTPSYIDDNIHWITQAPYPDIIDDSVTGEVTIGGRIAGSRQQMICNSAYVSNLVSKSIVSEGRVENSVRVTTSADTSGIITAEYNEATSKFARPYLLGDYRNQESGTGSIATLGEINNRFKFGTIETPEHLTQQCNAIYIGVQWVLNISGSVFLQRDGDKIKGYCDITLFKSPEGTLLGFNDIVSPGRSTNCGLAVAQQVPNIVTGALDVIVFNNTLIQISMTTPTTPPIDSAYVSFMAQVCCF